MTPVAFKPSVPLVDCERLVRALQAFEQALPDWWFSLGVCSVSRDVSCGPDRNGQDAYLLETRIFDEGFHVDLRDGDLTDALGEATKLALEAKREFCRK